MPAPVGTPVLGKRQNDEAESLPDGDTATVIPGDAESAAEFFVSFFPGSDKADLAYSNLISISPIIMFENSDS